MKLRIALVRSQDGHSTLCGPDDYKEGEHTNALDAALCWHLEAGHLPAECVWVEVDLPPVPDLPTLRAQAERGEFPRSFIEDMEQP